MNWDRRLTGFLGASIAAHILVVLTAGIWVAPKSTTIWIAPEISIELSGVHAVRGEPGQSVPASPPRPQPDDAKLASESASSSSVATPASRAEAAPATELTNHLLAALHAAVAQRFVYPPMARRYGWEGNVQVRLQIEADGHVNALRMLRSSGYAILDEDALQILRSIGVLPQAHVWLSGQTYELDFKVIYRLTES